MLNKIIDGICIALNSEFGDDYRIYTENIEQGLIEPCFLIKLINPTNELYRDKKYYRKNLFSISYFPENQNETQNECNEVLDRLFDCLEIIDIDGDAQRGTGMNGEIVENVLHFFVNYNMFIYKVENQTPMETLDITSEVEG